MTSETRPELPKVLIFKGRNPLTGIAKSIFGWLTLNNCSIMGVLGSPDVLCREMGYMDMGRNVGSSGSSDVCEWLVYLSIRGTVEAQYGTQVW